jgi:hypothetical protein
LISKWRAGFTVDPVNIKTILNANPQHCKSKCVSKHVEKGTGICSEMPIPVEKKLGSGPRELETDIQFSTILKRISNILQ